MTLLGAADIRSLAAAAGVRPSKSRGQNFVVDGNTIRRIVRLADLPDDGVVLEVGPGLGSLTLGLLADGHQVVAVEIDPALAHQLPDTVADFQPESADRIAVTTADAGAISQEITHEFGPPTALVANLPYNVAVPVLLHCLAEFSSLQRSVVMVQLEVADRLAAAPGSRDYGVPSVKAAWFGDVHRVGTVPAAVFWPVPRVESGLVRIDRRAAPATSVSRRQVFRLVDLLFSQRRKMVRAVLGGQIGREAAVAALAAADIDPTVRPENLALSDFCRLAESIPPQQASTLG